MPSELVERRDWDREPHQAELKVSRAALENAMPNTFRITVNGTEHAVTAEGNTPLLYILRNDLGLNGPKVWLQPRASAAPARPSLAGTRNTHLSCFRCQPLARGTNI